MPTIIFFMDYMGVYIRQFIFVPQHCYGIYISTIILFMSHLLDFQVQYLNIRGYNDHPHDMVEVCKNVFIGGFTTGAHFFYITVDTCVSPVLQFMFLQIIDSGFVIIEEIQFVVFM